MIMERQHVRHSTRVYRAHVVIVGDYTRRKPVRRKKAKSPVKEMKSKSRKGRRK